VSTIITLLPDARYTERRPQTTDHHLTLGDFGDLDPDSPQVSALKWATWKVSEQLRAFSTRNATVSGLGVFDISQEGFEHDYAVVDLIDGWFVYQARKIVDEMTGSIGVSMSRAHGFTPHMTLGYGSRLDEMTFQFGEMELFKIGFHAIALWSGAQRWEYAL
jgi:2'-5' RNA ligase